MFGATEDEAIAWRRIAIFWLIAAAFLVAWKWPLALTLDLPDTDDNMRLMQVRDWLAGADWFAIDQPRIAPPLGLGMHWSRVVDLPLAGLILVLQPVLGRALAESVAVSVAPLLPLGVAMAATALIVARLLRPALGSLACIFLLALPVAMQMLTPLRIDHHGWQMALTLLMLAGLLDPERWRGGLVSGLAAGTMLAIGLETLPYVSIAVAFVLVRWAIEPDEAPRLRALAATLVIGATAGLLLFVPPSRYLTPGCDALGLPHVAAAAGGAVAVAFLTRMPQHAGWRVRLAAAATAGGVLVVLVASAYPQCAAGPYAALDPSLVRLWLSQVKEARPLSALGIEQLIVNITPVSLGIIGAVLALASSRDRAARWRWGAALTLVVLGAGLMVWQVRAAPIAHALSVAGTLALVDGLLARVRHIGPLFPRVLASSAMLISATGIAPVAVAAALPATAASAAGARCNKASTLAPLAQLPPGLVLAHLDLGPAIILHSRHSAVAGPYHRNGVAILDVLRFWRGDADRGEAFARARGVAYVVLCRGRPGAAADGSMRERLLAGRTPPWLTPVTQPADAPLLVWRVRPA